MKVMRPLGDKDLNVLVATTYLRESVAGKYCPTVMIRGSG